MKVRKVPADTPGAGHWCRLFREESTPLCNGVGQPHGIRSVEGRHCKSRGLGIAR